MMQAVQAVPSCILWAFKQHGNEGACQPFRPLRQLNPQPFRPPASNCQAPSAAACCVKVRTLSHTGFAVNEMSVSAGRECQEQPPGWGAEGCRDAGRCGHSGMRLAAHTPGGGALCTDSHKARMAPIPTHPNHLAEPHAPTNHEHGMALLCRLQHRRRLEPVDCLELSAAKLGC